MREVERIADLLRRAHEGEAWHGPSMRELLAGLTAEQASARPVAGAHTIKELVLHAAAWERAVLRRLGGDPATIYNTSEDWPDGGGESDEDSWASALRLLSETNAALREAVLRLDDSKLEEPIRPKMSSVYMTLHGVAQHTLYHAGQIAFVKKALGLGNSYDPSTHPEATA